MKKLFPLFSLIIFSFIISLPCYSQFSAGEARKNYRNSKASDRGLDRYFRYTSVGGSLNAFNYYGDLAPWQGKLSTDFNYTRPGLGLVVMRRITPVLSLRGTYTFGRVRADDFSADLNHPASKDRYRRNLHFRSDIHEFSFTGVIDFIKNRKDYAQRPFIVPYAFLGVAVFHHNPKARFPLEEVSEVSEWIPLQPLQTEGVGYSRVQIATPVGVGARLKLMPRLDLAVEIGFRQLYTDYLDDVSTVYADPGALNSELSQLMAGRSLEPYAAAVRKERDGDILMNAYGRIITYDSPADGNTYHIYEGNRPGSKRGNKNDNDVYIVTSIQLTYVILPKMYKAKHRE